MSEESKLLGFKISQKQLLKILGHLQASGTTQAGEHTEFMDDCIIRVDSKGIWSITIDTSSNIIAHAQVNVVPFTKENEDYGLETYGKDNIPVNYPHPSI